MTTQLTTTTTTTSSWAGAVHTTLPSTWRRPTVVTVDPVESELDDGVHHDAERIVFTGQVGGDAYAQVWVRVDDAPWARADRAVLGEWVYTTPGTLRAGSHAVHVRTTDDAGVPLASAGHEFTVLPHEEAVGSRS